MRRVTFACSSYFLIIAAVVSVAFVVELDMLVMASGSLVTEDSKINVKMSTDFLTS